MYEYESHFKTIIEKYGLHFIFLVTPETSEERIRQLDRLSTGFLYAVSSSSITGSDKDFAPVETYLQRLQAMELVTRFLLALVLKTGKHLASHAAMLPVPSLVPRILRHLTDPVT
jgi:tryptophan synthase alpha chain